MLSVGARLGPYKILSVIGTGGMGQVFKAIDGQTGQLVAIKVIGGSEALSEGARMRFVREARAVGQLQHPNIVAVHDIGQVNGALYMVMEYVRGVPLTSFIPAPNSLPLRSKLSILAQAAEALGYAHSQGVVHSDIKPANILVMDDEAVKLVDFGIAALAGLSNSLVRGSGTIPYMSPEQLEEQNLDAGSDIWSAGVILFELLTAKRPYRTIHETISAPPPVLPHGLPLASELNIVLARALAKDRQMRYTSAEEFGADLRMLQLMCERANVSTQEIDDVSVRDTMRLALESSPVPTTLDTPTCNPKGEVEATAAAPVQPTGRLSLPLEPAPAARSYALPNLNFSRPAEGTLGTTAGVFKWKQRKRTLRARRESVWGEAERLGSRLFRPMLRRSPLSIVWLPPLWFLLGCLALSKWVALTVWMAVCSGFDVPDHLPRCKGCRLRMRLTARWTRLVKSTEEVVLGYGDCMAALKHGLWQDAAKLLTIHGAEHMSEYGSHFITPARYHISFFECMLCGHHGARLTTDVTIEGTWEEQTKFEEAYWRGTLIRPSLLSILAAAPRVHLRTLLELVRNLFQTRPNRPAWITCCAAALFLALILWLRA